LRASIVVTGIVQGVGFRPFVYRTAVDERLRGFVRNRADAVVEIILEGEKERIDSFIQRLRGEKPPLARLDSVQIEFSENESGFPNFKIETSSQNRSKSGSVIPPDIAICNDCLKELNSQADRRCGYFFITCTNCGPRYTTIVSLPYDRPNTTMQDFLMCAKCREEYTNPLDRRFHAQTIACADCGPKVTLTDNAGSILEVTDPIREAGKLLAEGKTLAIKGNGGFHLACSTTQDEPIKSLRRSKDRRNKPFALMARDMDSTLTFARVRTAEKQALESYIRPIVLLQKSEAFDLSSLISPGLDSVGVMLPYTGMHWLIFAATNDPALIMTSANAPNEPIITENDRALKSLRDVVDYFLVHDREIAQRADDSVVRLVGETLTPVRRSRGYAPAPILLKNNSQARVLGVGGELNVTSCMILENKAYLTQHIGDTETVETARFLKDATRHLGQLIGFSPDRVACDLHPKFTTTRLAETISNGQSIPINRIQHHHAHAGSLMAEHSLDEIVAIVCDGFGLGDDGEAWGGEILLCHGAEVKRVAHLEKQPMIGGDRATRYPARMVAGILSDDTTISDWLKSNPMMLPHGAKEAELILQQLGKGDFIWSTSCGRILDSIAAILGICYERTYEGEPAMRLESSAREGIDRLRLSPEIEDDTIRTTNLVSAVYKERCKMGLADLAFSAHSYLARALGVAAVNIAKREGVKTIGFSGGVALNETISSIIRSRVVKEGFRFVSNEAVPPGDGGISFGQAHLASLQQ